MLMPLSQNIPPVREREDYNEADFGIFTTTVQYNDWATFDVTRIETTFDNGTTTFLDKITSVIPDKNDETIDVSFTDFTVTISGYYTRIHLNRYYDYNPQGSDEHIIARYESIPAKIQHLTQFVPVPDVPIVVTYTVKAAYYKQSVALIKQQVYPNWSIGRDELVTITVREEPI